MPDECVEKGFCVAARRCHCVLRRRHIHYQAVYVYRRSVLLSVRKLPCACALQVCARDLRSFAGFAASA